MKKILIIGAGAMGSAFTVPCVDNNNEVTLVGTHLENELIASIKKNNKFHPTLKTNLPAKLNIERFENLKSIIEEGADIIVAAISSVGIKWFAEEISKFYKKKLPIVLLTKGLSVENDELITLSEKISILLKEKGHNEINISAIKGPCLATGLANKMRSGTVIANPDIKEAQFLKKIISTDYYSTEITNDLQGVEISSAIKNIYSMLIGASIGLSGEKIKKDIQEKYYHNTASALFKNALAEMKKFIKLMGGKEDTAYGLAGLGDLYVSVAGGRNSMMGKYLGQGHLYLDIKEQFMKNITVEGADLALEIGPKILKDFNNNDFPIMFSLVKSICENKKLEINW